MRTNEFFTIVIFVFVFMCSISEAQSTDQGAKITQLVGKVEIRSHEKATWKNARAGMPVRQSWDIRTYLESSAEITFETGTVLRTGENTVVSLSQLSKNEKAGTTQTTVKMLTGQMWANVKKISNSNSRMDFETPTAVASIRGTRIGIEVKKDRTRIDVFEGLVAVRKRNSNQTVSVSPNFRAVIENNSSNITVVEFKDIKTDETTGNLTTPVDPFSTAVSLPDSTTGSPVMVPDSSTSGNQKEIMKNDSIHVRDSINKINTDTVDLKNTSSVQQDVNSSVSLQIVSPVSGSVVLETPVILRGKTKPGATVKINDKTVETGSDGIFAEMLDLKPGENSFNVDALINGKHVNQRCTYEYHPKLELSVQNIENNMEVSSKNIKLDISVSENAEFSINGKTGEENVTLAEGKNTIVVEAWDDWNARIVQQYLVMYKPSVTFSLNVVSPLSGQKIKEPFIQVTGSTTAGAKVYVNDISVRVGREGFFSSRIPVADEPQSYVMEIRAEYNGEEQVLERTVVYEPVKEKLKLEIIAPQKGQVINRKSIRCAGKTSSQTQVWLNSRVVPVMANGTFSYDFPIQEENIGYYTLDVTARNADQEITKSIDVMINGKSSQVNTSIPQCIVQSNGRQAVRTPNMIIQALDRTPDENLMIEIKNNGFSEVITTESGKNEQYSLLEGKNQYSVFVKDMALNTSNTVSGSIYYLPGPLYVSFIEPPSSQMVVSGVPPMPGKKGLKPFRVVIEIEDGIGTVPETIKYCKLISNGQTFLLRNNNDYIYKGDIPIVRGNNYYTVFVEDLAGNTISTRLEITIE
ncbi:MAG: FecR domain-containing protein [Chitinispirillaceae bacterium]|nr:FecR domain-containing protein [Chitinispirillaceae bacterium]